MKAITKAVFILTLFSIISRILGFVFRIYLSHTIGEQGIALYQISTSLFFVLLTIVASGIPSIISRQVAKYNARQEYNKIHNIISSSLILVAVLDLIIVFVMVISRGLFSFLKINEQAIELLYLLIPAFIFSSFQNVFKGFMWGRSDFLKMSIIDFIEQLLRILLCFLLATNLFKVSTLYATVYSLNFACLISLLLCLFNYIRNKGKFKFSKQEGIYIVKTSFPITMVRIVGSLVGPITAIAVPLILSSVGYTESQALGLYGATTGMVLPLLALPGTFIGSLSLALIPDLSSKLALQNNHGIVNQVKSAITFTTIISLILVPIFTGLGYDIAKVLFNSELAGSLLTMSAWIMLPMGLNNLSSSMINAVGLELKGFINYIVGTIGLVLCIVIFPKYIGINAVIIGLGVSLTISSVLNISMLSKKLRIKFKILKTVLLLCVLILPVYILIVNCFGVLKFVFPSLINIVICGSVGALAYLLLCLVFNIIDISHIKIGFTPKKKVKTN